MPQETGTRRLAAILAADMVGYSRLMEADEADIIARQRALRAEVVDPLFERHNGRIFKTTGDGLLAEFGSAVDAVACAVAIQQAVTGREAETRPDRRIAYRVGINLGDVVTEDGDVFGDGVNIAARIEGLARPGGVSVSDVVYQSVLGKLDLAFDDAGEKTVKNLRRPVHVWAWRADGPLAEVGGGNGQGVTAQHQEIRFCTAPDGVELACAAVGDGPDLVKAPNWMNHLEYDWESPVWRHLLRDLARDRRLIRFDQRGNGLSDRDPAEISFNHYVGDLECVVDSFGLDRFPLLGISQGCAVSVAYAVRNPGRVSRLVLYGGFGKGRMRTGRKEDSERADFERQMIAQGWGQDNPAFRQFFASSFMPGATREQMDWFNELQRRTVSPEVAVRLREVSDSIDVADLLSQVSVPTLVLHCQGDAVAPFEAGRRMAAKIPGARFVPLEGDNHMILEDEPAWPRFREEVRRFLAEDDVAAPA